MKRFIGNTVPAAVIAAALTVPALSTTAAGQVYIPLGSAGEVAIVDSGADRVVGKIAGVPAVHGLAATPDGRFLIAGSYQEREPGTAMPAKPAGVSEEEHAAHHGPASAASHRGGNMVSTVSVIRTDDRSVVRRIDVPGAVHHVAVSPDGRFAVVTHPNAGSISAIDLTSFEVVAEVETGAFPNYAAFGPEGKRVYVSNAGGGTVSAVDTEVWRVAREFRVGTSPEHIVLSADGATLYVNNVDDGTVSRIAVATGEAVKTFPVGEVLHGIDLSDDGETLFVGAMGDDKVVAIDLPTGESRSATLTPAPYHLAVVRGSGKFYISSADEPKVWVVDQQSLAVIGEFRIGGKGHQMVQAAGR